MHCSILRNSEVFFGHQFCASPGANEVFFYSMHQSLRLLFRLHVRSVAFGKCANVTRLNVVDSLSTMV